MALPSSGTISMSQVNTELGYSSTATLDLNNAFVRGLFGVPSGTISMSNGYGQAAEYFILTGGSSFELQASVAPDYSGGGVSYLVAGYTGSQGGSASNISLIKYALNGDVLWQVTLSSSLDDYAYDVVVDSSGNSYICGQIINASTGNSTGIVAKYNSSGVLQWQQTLSTAVSGGLGLRSIAVDSAGNVYVAGYVPEVSTYYYDMLLVKYSPSGVFQWARAYGDSVSASSDSAYSVVIDSSDNIYVGGQSASPGGAGGQDFLLVRYDTSGNVIWAQSLGNVDFQYNGYLALDSSGNIYCSFYNSSTYRTTTLAKYNSSGTLQWQRTISGASWLVEGYFCAVDSSGNATVVGVSDENGPGAVYNGFLTKFDSSGNTLFQRILGSTSGSVFLFGCSTNQRNDICVSGYFESLDPNSPQGLFAVLPSNGSATGTYGYISYAASANTVSVGTLTSLSRSLTARTPTVTSAASSLVSATSTLPTTKYNI